MNSSVHFVELDNRIITATYRNLMIKAKVVLVDTASGRPLSEPVTHISSPLPVSQLRIRLPDSVKAGHLCPPGLQCARREGGGERRV